LGSILAAREQSENAWRRLEQQFEREFWQEYEHTVPAALKQMQELAETLAQARRLVK